MASFQCSISHISRWSPVIQRKRIALDLPTRCRARNGEYERRFCTTFHVYASAPLDSSCHIVMPSPDRMEGEEDSGQLLCYTWSVSVCVCARTISCTAALHSGPPAPPARSVQRPPRSRKAGITSYNCPPPVRVWARGTPGLASHRKVDLVRNQKFPSFYELQFLHLRIC